MLQGSAKRASGGTTARPSAGWREFGQVEANSLLLAASRPGGERPRDGTGALDV